jgi:hypothetical protein
MTSGLLCVGVIWLSNGLNHFYSLSVVLCAMCPRAEAVRGWRTLNCPTVCTIARLHTGLSFYA